MMSLDVCAVDSVQGVSVNRNWCFCLNTDVYIGDLTDIYNT